MSRQVALLTFKYLLSVIGNKGDDNNEEANKRYIQQNKDVLLPFAQALLEIGDFKNAEKYYREMIAIDKYCDAAHWGILLATRHCKNDEELLVTRLGEETSLNNDENYKNAFSVCADLAVKYQTSDPALSEKYQSRKEFYRSVNNARLERYGEAMSDKGFEFLKNKDFDKAKKCFEELISFEKNTRRRDGKETEHPMCFIGLKMVELKCPSFEDLLSIPTNVLSLDLEKEDFFITAIETCTAEVKRKPVIMERINRNHETLDQLRIDRIDTFMRKELEVAETFMTKKRYGKSKEKLEFIKEMVKDIKINGISPLGFIPNYFFDYLLCSYRCSCVEQLSDKRKVKYTESDLWEKYKKAYQFLRSAKSSHGILCYQLDLPSAEGTEGYDELKVKDNFYEAVIEEYRTKGIEVKEKQKEIRKGLRPYPWISLLLAFYLATGYILHNMIELSVFEYFHWAFMLGLIPINIISIRKAVRAKKKLGVVRGKQCKTLGGFLCGFLVVLYTGGLIAVGFFLDYLYTFMAQYLILLIHLFSRLIVNIRISSKRKKIYKEKRKKLLSTTAGLQNMVPARKKLLYVSRYLVRRGSAFRITLACLIHLAFTYVFMVGLNMLIEWLF